MGMDETRVHEIGLQQQDRTDANNVYKAERER